MINYLIGRIVTIPAVRDRLYRIAMADPDSTIFSPDGKVVYMERGWLFNPVRNGRRKYPWIPLSLRVHHIRQPDLDRHLHDHPWAARTWIMQGGYDELRREEMIYDCMHGPRYDLLQDAHKGADSVGHPLPGIAYDADWDHVGVLYKRRAGDTSELGVDQYHKIVSLQPGGAVTLFAFGTWRADWGFIVEGSKVPRREYEARYKNNKPEGK